MQGDIEKIFSALKIKKIKGYLYIMNEKIVIPLSKFKISLLLIGSLVFVVLGIFFLASPETFVTTEYHDKDSIRIFGLLSVLFFGAAGFISFRKLYDKKSGLIIDDNGIHDNSNVLSVGLIEWADIQNVKRISVFGNDIILIFTSCPEKYIERVKGIKQKSMRNALKEFGTPLQILPKSLKIKSKQLENLIKEKLDEFGR